MGSDFIDCKLGDLVTFQRGKDLPKNKMTKGPYPVIGSNGIIGWHNTFVSEGPVITIGRSGNTGKPFIYQDAAWAHNTTLYIKEYRNCIPKFIYYFLQTLDLQSYAGGSAVPTLNRNHIHTLDVRIPNIKIQRIIVDILEPIDEKVLSNIKVNDYLLKIGKIIWEKTALRNSSILMIRDVAKEVITGKTPSTKKIEYYGELYPFITIPDMRSGVWLCSTERSLSETGNETQSRKLVQRGSVLVSCIATIGLVGIVQRPSHFNQQINAVIPKNAGEEFYLYYAMRSIKQKLLGIGATGSTTPNVNKDAFSNIEIPWPSQKDMRRYVKTVEPLFRTMEANTIESLHLQELRDALLPKLMSGEIDVSRIDLPE